MTKRSNMESYQAIQDRDNQVQDLKSQIKVLELQGDATQLERLKELLKQKQAKVEEQDQAIKGLQADLQRLKDGKGNQSDPSAAALAESQKHVGDLEMQVERLTSYCLTTQLVLTYD